VRALDRRGLTGLGLLAEQLGQSCPGEAAELAARPAALEHRDLELVRGQPTLLAGGRVGPEQLDGQGQRIGQRQAGLPALAQRRRDRLGLPAHHDEAMLVGDRAVVGEAVHLVLSGGLAHLRDHDLDLVGLGLLGEDRAERLRVGVGQAAAGHVAAVVGVAAQVGEAHTRDAQVLELVVLADGREGDAVVDLADLVQRPGEVLADEQDAVVIGEYDDAATPGDALAGIVGAVLHQLFGRDVSERHRHGAVSSRVVSGVGRAGQCSCAGGPSGCCMRAAMTDST